MRNTKLDIEELRTFVEVADAGGVSSAALRLGVSKSIVSRRLFRLEEELGVQLLSRSTRGAALTEAGATFRDHAARVCAEIDVAREAILPAGDLRGRLRIAAPFSLGPTHFAPILAEMARRHPGLHIQTCYSDRFVDLIAEGYDCAIRVGYLPDSNLIARRIGPVHGKLVASPAYVKAHGSPETPEELLAHQALMQRPKPGTSRMATRPSRFARKGASRPTTARRWSPLPRQDWASPTCPTGSPMNMWPPGRWCRS